MHTSKFHCILLQRIKFFHNTIRIHAAHEPAAGILHAGQFTDQLAHAQFSADMMSVETSDSETKLRIKTETLIPKLNCTVLIHNQSAAGVNANLNRHHVRAITDTATIHADPLVGNPNGHRAYRPSLQAEKLEKYSTPCIHSRRSDSSRRRRKFLEQ